MELKLYFQVLLRKWWIIVPSFLVTLMVGIILTYSQTPTYRASTTYVVAPSPSFDDVRSYASGLNILSTRQEIATTYAEIAASRTMRQEAMDSLGLPPEVRPDYRVSGQVKAGTNIIIISAEGPHPEVVRDLANRVGEDLRLYGQGLYETFVINSLDPATRPGSPIQPNKPLNIALAGIFGLILGVGLAFLSNYLQMPLASNVSVSVLDAETGVYNKEYMIRRLSEEMGRAKRNRYPLSLALMQIDELAMIRGANASKVKQEILRQVAVLTNQYLREEDIVARFSKDTFACLLPDTSGENAKAIMEYLQTRIAWTPFESQASGTKFNLKGVVGITAYNHNGTSREELIDKASQALKMAQISGESKSYLALDDILEDAAAHRHDEVARI